MRLVMFAALAMVFVAGAPASEPGHGARKMSAEEIVAKNVAARGGLEAWRKVETMVWVGHMESADPNVPSLRFVLEQKRPNMTRFEVAAPVQKTLRVFDGAHGWKLRPERTGGVTAEPYSRQEIEFAKQAQGIDGPLIDYRAKGISVELAGIESIEGRPTYRLHVKLGSGEVHDVWIDAKTFLDVKYDRTSYTASGAHGTVSVFYRDYKSIEGLQIPGILEIGAGSGKVADRMVIENIALNPPLEDKLFTRPDNAHRRRMATVNMDAPTVDPRQAFSPTAVPPTTPLPTK